MEAIQFTTYGDYLQELRRMMIGTWPADACDQLLDAARRIDAGVSDELKSPREQKARAERERLENYRAQYGHALSIEEWRGICAKWRCEIAAVYSWPPYGDRREWSHVAVLRYQREGEKRQKYGTVNINCEFSLCFEWDFSLRYLANDISETFWTNATFLVPRFGPAAKRRAA